jgi:hypothetical protein
MVVLVPPPNDRADGDAHDLRGLAGREGLRGAGSYGGREYAGLECWRGGGGSWSILGGGEGSILKRMDRTERDADDGAEGAAGAEGVHARRDQVALRHHLRPAHRHSPPRHHSRPSPPPVPAARLRGTCAGLAPRTRSMPRRSVPRRQPPAVDPACYNRQAGSNGCLSPGLQPACDCRPPV